MKKFILLLLLTSLAITSVSALKIFGDRLTNEQFGNSVASDGNWAVTGAKFWYGGDPNYSGAIYIYKRTSPEWNTDWLRYDRIQPANSSTWGHAGFDVDIKGSYIITGGDYAAKASIFKLVGDNWNNEIVLANPSSDNYFGRSVDLATNYAIVGANDHTFASHAGTAYIYSKNEGGADNWGYIKQLVASDVSSNDYFGTSVAIDGNIAVVGAYGRDGVYVYRRDEGGANNWGESQILVGSDTVPGDDFGYDVDLDGIWLTVGSKDSYEFYIFKDVNGTFVEHAHFNTPAAGASVAIDAPYCIVGGSPTHTTQKAYLYKLDLNSDSWNLLEEVQRPVESATWSADVEVSGNQIFITDDQQELNTLNSGTEGACYIFGAEADYEGKPHGTFTIENYEAGPVLANWMYSEANMPYVHNANDIYNVYAYETLQWNETEGAGRYLTEAHLHREDAAVFDGLNPDLLDMSMDSFSLSGYRKFNTESNFLTWDDWGTPAAGDNRFYDGGNGSITYDGQNKLVWSNMRINFTTPYPFKQTISGNRVGTGGAIVGDGQADLDVANCDPAWLAEFDPDGTGQLRFVFDSFSPVHQSAYGYYNFDVTITPVLVPITYSRDDVPVEGDGVNHPVSMDDEGVDFFFQDIYFGTGDGNDLICELFREAPNGNVPDGINSMPDRYWHFGTTFDSFLASIYFDISQLPSPGDMANLRIYRRIDEDSDWEEWADVSIEDQVTLRADNVNGFSDWMVASTEDGTLPVELSSFNAIQTKSNFAEIQWITQSESDNQGFNIYKSESDLYYESQKINAGVISGHNSSTQSEYSFTDIDVNFERTYYYWLESVSLDGNSKTYGPVSVTIKREDSDVPDVQYVTELSSIYPNPFNPKTNISYSIEESGMVQLDVFNLKGQKVKTLVSSVVDAGEHVVTWKGDTDSGKSAATGMYFVRMNTKNFRETRKILMIK